MPSDSHATAAAPLVVVVAAGSSARCRALSALLGGPGFRVVAEASTPEDVESAVSRFRPHAVLLDTDLVAGGLETIERVMASTPTPIVVCGAAASDPQSARGAGAVDMVGALDGPPTSPQYVVSLRRHLHFASRIRVITHPRGKLRRAVAVTGAAAAAASAPHGVPLGLAALAPAGVAVTVRPPPGFPVAAPPPVAPPRTAHPTWSPPRPGRPLTVVPRDASANLTRPVGVDLVVIGASTGGPPALATILGELPAAFPAPILVVQHMAEGFVESLAEWLNSVSPLPVELARDGVRLRPGSVSIAPAGVNVIVRRGLRVELMPPLSGQFHVPGIDATFTSVAESCAGRAIGVLLTGMGRDGAAGLRRLRESGAMTIGQDEATSIVYGMPAAARALNAVELELALPHVASTLIRLLDRPAPPARSRP